jgi:DNA invertase Pin-like site-specific DNA recombinase
MSARTVRRVIAEERGQYVGRARQRREQIIDLYRQGHTAAAIAEQLKVTRQLVSLRLREARRDGVDLSRSPGVVPCGGCEDLRQTGT